jgi:hypothetical protein
VFGCTQCSLSHATGKSLVVLSQDIRVDTPHSSLPYPSSHSAKCAEHWFYRQQAHESIPIQTTDCVKMCNTVLTLLLSVELQGLQSLPYPYLALFRQFQTYHATMHLLHILVVVSKFISPSLHLIHILLFQ